jgi:hypothetical protein
VIGSPFQPPDARVQWLRFIRREVTRDGGFGFGQGLGTLGLGGAWEVVDGHNGLILSPQLLELAPGLRLVTSLTLARNWVTAVSRVA